MADVLDESWWGCIASCQFVGLAYLFGERYSGSEPGMEGESQGWKERTRDGRSGCEAQADAGRGCPHR